MAKSLLAAVHEAVLVGAAENCPQAGETGAVAPYEKEEAMSEDTKPAGGDKKNAGISQADHDAAVQAASASGKAEGAKSATDRLVSALGAEGVKGDAARMSAALDLAAKSPAMSGEEVAAFVVANVTASTKADADAGAYEAQRLAAAGAAQPKGQSAGEAASAAKGWEAAFKRTNAS